MANKKPCPFCGSYSEILDDHAENCYLVLFAYRVYKWCGMETDKDFTRDEEINAWNTRVYPGDETAEYFILPKPKEKLANEYSAIKCDSNSVPHATYGYEIIQDALNRWQDQIDAEIKKKLFEAFRPTCKRENITGETYIFTCSECKEHIIDDDKFCPNCGAKVVKRWS